MFDFLLAILPITLILFLILVLKWHIAKAMLLALCLLLPIVFFGWQMPFNWILAASINGILFALEILIIILGALFFLNILNKKGFKEKLKTVFQGISRDRRIQVIIIGFIFAAIIEASSGFGTPAMLLAPILIFLGFPALAAVTLVLIGASIFTIFGALGLPVVIGFKDVLNLHNIDLIEIATLISFMNILMVFLVSLSMIVVLVYVFGHKKNRKIKYILEMIPFLIFASLTVTVPGLIISWLIGPELAFLVGGVIGLILTIIAVQKKWLIPKIEWDFNQTKKIENNSKNRITIFPLLRLLIPYFFLILILFLSRANFLPFEVWLQNIIRINWQGILGTTINYSFSLLYSIGILLIIAGLINGLVYKIKFREIKNSLKNSLLKIKAPLFALMVILVFVKIFIHSGYGQVDSLIVVLTQELSQLLGIAWPIFAPAIGSMGSFIVGSTTVSNILLGGVQADIALGLGLTVTGVLALQGIGAALGNMISFHNIIAVSSVVDLKEKASKVILFNLPVVLILGLILGLIVFLFFS